MSICNRKHWHAFSHSLHFVRQEGRLATIGRTRLTRSLAANVPGFLYTRSGTSSSSYSGMPSGWPARWSLVLVHLVLNLCSGWRREPSQRSSYWGFVFLLFQSPCLVGFRFFRFTGLSKFSFTKFRFAFCLPPVTVKSIVCPCKLNCGRQYWQFVFKLSEVGAIQNCSTFRVLPRTRELNFFAFCNFYLSRLWGSEHAVFFTSFVG